MTTPVLWPGPLPDLYHFGRALQVVGVAGVVYLHLETCLVAWALAVLSHLLGGSALVRGRSPARPLARAGLLVLPSHRLLPFELLWLSSSKLANLLARHLFRLWTFSLTQLRCSLLRGSFVVRCHVLEGRVFLRYYRVTFIILILAQITRGRDSKVRHLVVMWRQKYLLGKWVNRLAAAEVYFEFAFGIIAGSWRQIEGLLVV